MVAEATPLDCCVLGLGGLARAHSERCAQRTPLSATTPPNAAVSMDCTGSVRYTNSIEHIIISVRTSQQQASAGNSHGGGLRSVRRVCVCVYNRDRARATRSGTHSRRACSSSSCALVHFLARAHIVRSTSYECALCASTFALSGPRHTLGGGGDAGSHGGCVCGHCARVRVRRTAI